MKSANPKPPKRDGRRNNGGARPNTGGPRPGAGRKKKAVKFADLKTITDAELESIVRDEVPTAMRELVRGVGIVEPTKSGERYYRQSPNLGAIIACLDRVFGKVTEKREISGHLALSLEQLAEIKARAGD